MFKGSVSRLRFRQLEDLFHTGIAGDLSDSELLDRFLCCEDSVGEAAFAALVQRHGPMVFRVCRQALKNHHAAQDAVQATFLVLARQAGTIRKRTSVSSWLYGVARRAAARIRMEEARRRWYELRAVDRSSALFAAQQEPLASELYPELHAEIERLPEKYRVPIVLCYFEGLTHEQAASRLRWPLGTVKIRLSRARERLRSRLEARGRPSLLLLPANAFRPGHLAELPENLVNAITPAGCRYATTGVAGGLVSSAVIKITQGVMQSMLMYKLKLAGAFLCSIFVLGLGALVAAQQAAGKGADGQALAAVAETDYSPTMLRLNGTTELVPDMIVRVHPRFECRVDRVLVDIGQRLKKGDPVVELFSTELARAKNDYQTAVTQWARDKRVVDSTRKIAGENALVIEAENNEAQSRLKARTAKEQLLVYGVTDEEIENIGKGDGLEKAKMILRSRGEGLVIQRMAVPGNFYDTKDTLMVIARNDVLRVTAAVHEQHLPNVKVGQNVTVSFPYADRQVKGKLEFIDSRVDPANHTVRIRTSIPNPDGRFKPGSLARMALEPDARHDSVDEPRGSGEHALVATPKDRLNELERKVDRLLGEKEERTSHAKILERLDALEHKLDQLLGGADEAVKRGRRSDP